MSLSLNHFWQFLSQWSATIAGLSCFAIGFAGYFGAHLDPISQLSFLLVPTELGGMFDKGYWFALSAIGVWLVALLFVRLAAAAALALVVGKYAILEGWIPA